VIKWQRWSAPSRRSSPPIRRRPGINPSRSCSEEADVPYREYEDSADELLSRRVLPRWERVGGYLAVAGLLVTLVLIKLAGSSSGTTGAGPAPTATFGIPTRPPTFGAAQALDVVVDGNNEWVLSGSTLKLMRDGETIATTSVAFLNLRTTSVPLLALDPSRGVIWLVVGNAAPTQMIEFDSRTLQPMVTATWSQLVSGAAAVNGYLYLANDLGVAEMSPDTLHPRLVPGLRGAMGPIAADPTHHQLIAIDVSEPLAVYSYRHGQLPYESALRLPMGRGSLAVADGNIWVGGYGYRGAMLYQLDPRSLRPIAGGRTSGMGQGAVVMSAGQHVVWVRAGDPSSDLFVCMDATTGRVEQRFHLAGVDHVASTDGSGVVATHQGVLPLTMGNCVG
jgi:hypothetical protein